jgi:LysM repeat protein
VIQGEDARGPAGARPPRGQRVLAAFVVPVASLALAGCFATAKQLETVQTDVTKREAWSEERFSRMESEIEGLRAENEAFRQRMDEIADRIAQLGGEVSNRLEEIDRTSQVSAQQTGALALGREKDREEILNRMNVILEELVKENARLEERIRKLESSAVAFGKVHHVKKGETLASIARKYGTSVEAIAQANEISDASTIEIGQEILIPGSPK